MKVAPYWTCQIGGWGAYSAALFAVTTAYTGWRADIGVAYVLFFAYSIALTHGLRLVIRRRDWLALPASRGLPRLLGGAAIVGVMQTVLVTLVALALSGVESGFADPRTIASAGSGITVMTCAWTAAYVAVDWNRRYREARFREIELRATLAQAELRALRAQVNPHFLFNCLNTIRGMVSEDPARAQEMITNLAALFRHAIDFRGAQMVPLKDEMAVVSEYLALESARFEARLSVHIAISDEAAERHVPAMMVQTLVENAVTHGIAARPEGGLVMIRGHITTHALVLEVENTGRLMDVPPAHRAPTGLSNARDRLRLQCGAGATLELSDAGLGVVVATVVIPEPA